MFKLDVVIAGVCEGRAVKASEQHNKAAAAMCDELHRWATALAFLRT